MKNFDEKIWEKNRVPIMLEGLRAKVQQNTDIREKLKATGNVHLAEAADYDKIWGTGLDEINTKNYFEVKQKWPGRNLLGQCWTLVRKEI